MSGGTSHSFPRAIAGWRVTYWQPNLGEHTFVVTTHAELAKDKAWMDDAGYMYRIREITR